ncbi:MAG: PepSY domain-containing protein [Porticoccus sp.]
MNYFTKIVLTGLVAIGMSSSVLASSYECDSGPESEWKTKDEAKSVLVAEGYEVRKVKVEGGCYEFYTKKNGKKYEVFINPDTLEIAKIKED